MSLMNRPGFTSCGRAAMMVALLGSAVAAYAQDEGGADGASAWRAHLGGSARFDYFSADQQLDGTRNFYGTTFQQKLEAGYGDWLSAVAEGRETQPDITSGQGYHSSLLEGYVTLSRESTSLRLGQQIVAWGRADFLNPTDNLTPHDYTLLLPAETDQRSGTPAALLTQYIDNELTLAVFTTPYFEPSKVPLPRDFAVYVDERPEASWRHSELGIRLNRSGTEVEGSLSYFHGYSLAPDLAPLGVSPLGMPVLALQYGKVDVLGVDGATNVGRYGLRFEAAYTATAAADPGNSLRKNPFWYYVAGADRSFGDTLNVNLQVFGRHVDEFHEDQRFGNPLQQTVAAYDAIINNQQDRNSYGLTARISEYWWNNTLSAELLTVYNLTRSNAYIRPMSTYALTDQLMLSLGARLYTGSSNSFFGSLKKNQCVFVEMRLSL